jgi:hypothetical protein
VADTDPRLILDDFWSSELHCTHLMMWIVWYGPVPNSTSGKGISSSLFYHRQRNKPFFHLQRILFSYIFTAYSVSKLPSLRCSINSIYPKAFPYRHGTQLTPGSCVFCLDDGCYVGQVRRGMIIHLYLRMVVDQSRSTPYLSFQWPTHVKLCKIQDHGQRKLAPHSIYVLALK